MPDRSLLTVVNDNGLDAPRWVQHLVKIATGALTIAVIAAALMFAHVATGERAVTVAFAFSCAWFLSLRVAYWQDHKHDEPPAQLIKPDLWCDLALHVVAFAGVLAFDRHWLPAAAMLVGCALVYALTYPEATP